MRHLLAAVATIAMTIPALAQTGPVVVIPGRPGVPVMINGRDASYSVVEGDWGLRNVPPRPDVLGGGHEDVEPVVGHYYPSMGRLPGYGRVEIEPPADRPLPKPAETYRHSWTSQSAPPQPLISPAPPPIIYAPQFNGGRRRPPTPPTPPMPPAPPTR